MLLIKNIHWNVDGLEVSLTLLDSKSEICGQGFYNTTLHITPLSTTSQYTTARHSTINNHTVQYSLWFYLPVVRTHVPLFEHSVSACAVLTAVAWSDQARPYGHVRNEQSPPVYPSPHVHLLYELKRSNEYNFYERFEKWRS